MQSKFTLYIIHLHILLFPVFDYYFIITVIFIPQDLQGAIKKVSSFLQCSLGEDELNNCVKGCSFNNMKNNNMVNYTLIDEKIMDHSKGVFMRRGGALFFYIICLYHMSYLQSSVIQFQDVLHPVCPMTESYVKNNNKPHKQHIRK